MSERQDSRAAEREVVIRNREGLHFRPIMQFVDQATRFASRIRVSANGRDADGRSPMELLMLVGTCGTKLRISADGEDADAAVEALARLVDSGFGEP